MKYLYLNHIFCTFMIGSSFPQQDILLARFPDVLPYIQGSDGECVWANREYIHIYIYKGRTFCSYIHICDYGPQGPRARRSRLGASLEQGLRESDSCGPALAQLCSFKSRVWTAHRVVNRVAKTPSNHCKNLCLLHMASPLSIERPF